jgi:outer membrane immunogenic protein
VTGNAPINGVLVPASVTDKLNALATVRGRIGVAFDQVLLYGTAGLAIADNKMSASALGVTVSDNKTQTGWTAGAGVEWMFIPRWSLKAEYLYRSFGGVTLFAPAPAGVPTGTIKVNSGQFGVNYHF